VTSDAAHALLANGYHVHSRGTIRVKGVTAPVETFFVDPPQRFS
jgi:class 3 adenylate cyclase